MTAMPAGIGDVAVDDDKLIAHLTIPGEPQAAPRPQVTTSGRVYYPNDYKVNRDSTALLMLNARRRREPATGLVRLDVKFVRGSGRRKDADNLLKLVMDAGNGVLWNDDSQIVSGSWVITWGKPALTELEVRSL